MTDMSATDGDPRVPDGGHVPAATPPHDHPLSGPWSSGRPAGDPPSTGPPSWPPDDHGLDDNAPDDPGGDDLGTAHAEARQRAEAGDLTGARTQLEEALAAGELRYGRDHPGLAPLMVDLATIARNVGNLTEAQHQLRRAYGIAVSAAGPDHTTALSIEGRLAAVCYRLGEPTETYDWHLADVGVRVLGAEHPAVRGAQQRLAAAPVHEERTPPTDSPGEWPPPAVEEGGGWAPDYAGSYATPYAASADDPGVYHRLPQRDDVYVVQPPPRTYQQVDIWPEVQAIRARKGHTGGVALVASLGLAILIAAGVIAVQLFGAARTRVEAGQPPDGPPTAGATTGPPTAGPTASGTPSATAPVPGLPPTGVSITDNGGSVTLIWLDPSGGHVPFIVEGGRVGTQPKPIVTVPAGRATSTIYGLNERYDYCFTIAAVWSANLVQPSERTCTKRISTPATA